MLCWTGQLQDKRESLRDTIFYALYGTMVLFDTNANAFRYQKSCKSKNTQSLPVLVKEDATVLVRAHGRESRGGLSGGTVYLEGAWD